MAAAKELLFEQYGVKVGGPKGGFSITSFDGMTKAEVEKLLGSPTDCSGALGMSSCTWGDKTSFISVQYAGDKVLIFSGQGLK